MALVRILTSLALFALGPAVRGNLRGDTVIQFDTYECETAAPNIKIGAKSAVTVNIKARVSNSSDSVSGQNLWRVGAFGSAHPDGSGDRHGYVEQILTRKQASKPVEAGGTLKLKNIRTRFDLSQIGCGPVFYFCVEFARSDRSSVDCQLVEGGRRGCIVTCELLNCTRPYAPAEAPTHIATPVTTPGKVRLTLDAPRWNFDIYSICPDGRAWVNLNVTVPVRADSETILNGRHLWRIGLYGSSDPIGRSGEKQGYIEHVMQPYSYYSPNILPGREFQLTGGWRYRLAGIGCEDTEFNYLCVEIEKTRLARPSFEIANRPDKTRMVSCKRMQCITRETIERYVIARDSLGKSVISRYDVQWLLSALSAPELDIDEFISSLGSSNMEALPEAAPVA